MLDITRATFETDIIQASMTTPVLVDFWHPKSEQCLILVPLLEKLEIEYAGRFILAKVEIRMSIFPTKGIRFLHLRILDAWGCLTLIYLIVG